MADPSILFVLLIPLVFGIAIAFRLIAGSMDRERLRQYVEARGGKLISATWAPFGPGWFGGNKERIYQVRYLDHDHNVHDAYARTSMWTGVYFTDDHIIQYGKPPIDEEDVESLEEENARLRAELAWLKRKQRNAGSDAIEE